MSVKQQLAFASSVNILTTSHRLRNIIFRDARGKDSQKERHKTLRCSSQADPRSFWVLPKSKGALTTALEGNINDFMFTEKTDMDQWSSLGCFNSIYVDAQGNFDGGFLARISSAEDVNELTARAGTSDIVVIDSVDWKVIPAENLIASFQSTPTKLFALVDNVDEAKAMFGMLQVGVDGVILRSQNELEVSAFATLKRQLVDMVGQPLPGMSQAKITAIRPVGVGERVCIDTCSLLREDEGLMVGSSSQAMFLVLSEAAEVAYVPSRPFRVNAGPVHSYCLVPGGKTKYLAELNAGDEVLVVGDGGRTSRTAIVGRAKIETRPLLLIKAETEGSNSHTHTVFVQNAETVRLAIIDSTASTAMKGVTTLEVGDSLVLKTDRTARHIGIAIDEDLVEK